MRRRLAGTPGRASRLALASLVLASPAAAQTADPVFAGWSWAPEGLGSRAGGMGGAFVAVADGVQAAYVNPAGLALIPLTEVAAASGRPWLGVGTRLRRANLTAYAAETGVQRLDPGAPGGASLESSVREAGLGFGVEPISGVMLGGTVAWSRLRLDGQGPALGGSPSVVSGQDTHARLTAGMMLRLVGGRGRSLPSLRLGLAYQPGFDWSARMAGGSAGAAGRTFDVRRPSLISLGLAYRPTDRWALSAQGDVILYREVIDTLRRNLGDGAGFRLPDAVEPRVGAEFGAPLWCGCGVVKVRAGLHYRSPGTLQYVGVDPATAELFGRRAWRTVGTLGGSFFSEYFDHALRLDVDSRDLFEGPDLSFAIVWRF